VYVTNNHGIGEGQTKTPDCQILYTGTPVSCGASLGIIDDAAKARPVPLPEITLIVPTDHLVLHQSLSGITKSVAIYELSGKLVAKKQIRTNVVDLRKEFGIHSGVYLVKVNGISN
jgi:hypothetical protein